MSIEEYARKRKFENTPEPAPQAPASGGGRRFFAQRHHATRLHYDFRMEVGGVLVSWAVPKGPTLDPGLKQLAMKVEDHPLDYGDFEGNIPKGNYGAGSVMLWDRGEFEVLSNLPAEGQIARGDFKFRLHGEKLSGEFALVLMKGRGKGNEWLLLKKKDAFAEAGWDVEARARSVLTGRTQEEIARDVKPPPQPAAESKMPRDVSPMMGVLADALPAGDGWIYEVKWDGVRALCFIENGRVRLVSRNGRAMERQYPELSAMAESLSVRDAIVDGEIALLDGQGRPSFELLQSRINVSDAATIANLARKRPVVIYLFDVLFLNGRDMRGAPLRERKALLRSILRPSNLVRFSDDFTDGPALLAAARERDLEGVMAKRADSPYESRRSRSWLKIKVLSRQDFVVCGYTRDQREYFGALMLGAWDGGRFAFAGSVGTGFDGPMLKFVAQLLKPLETEVCPFESDPRIGKTVVWVEPRLVCEVKFLEWTGEGRLRAPVFLGLRNDVRSEQCIREQSADAVDEGEAADAAPPETAPRLQDPAPAPRFFEDDREEVTRAVGGHRLKFTNLRKIYYPTEGYTKRDVIEYYAGVAPLILPYLRDRPLSLKRYPDGIAGEWFFQKDAPASFPSWLRFEPVFSEHNQAPIRYVVADDEATLLFLANLGCIDQNPWMSRIGSLEYPDFILIDLDPQQCEFSKIVEAALLVKSKLDVLGLEGYPKTTGGDGMHVYIPVEPVYTYEQTKTFAEVLAHVVTSERPDLFTTPRAVAKREKGRVYFDFLQNGEGKTIAAPYVLRAYPGAPVATPLAWNEVKPGLLPTQFHIRNALERFARTGDLFEGARTKPQLLDESMGRLEKLVREAVKR
ncbi:MAG: DNA ligase D [Bryobacterales bacterium]|nr:DNA ligase D [Bryobacterales bacterium]